MRRNGPKVDQMIIDLAEDDPRMLIALQEAVNEMRNVLGTDPKMWEGAEVVVSLLSAVFAQGFARKLLSGAKTMPIYHIKTFGYILMIFDAVINEPPDDVVPVPN